MFLYIYVKLYIVRKGYVHFWEVILQPTELAELKTLNVSKTVASCVGRSAKQNLEQSF